MEYVKGETLKNYIKRKGSLSEKEAVKISRQVAEALKHAHSHNIVPVSYTHLILDSK